MDIDPQAVEVTKLSLLLKVLEGEDEESMGKQMYLIQERVLPDLSANIKCGNSLIGPDFYTHHQTDLFDEAEMYRVNAFDWQAEFAEIMKGGGFDAVIGNPPYVNVSSKNEQDYYSRLYQHQNYQKDLYLLFLERYSFFLKMNGNLGVIVSNTWLQSVLLTSIREYLTTKYHWRRILFLPEKVFKAVVDTHVLIFDKAQNVSGSGELTVDVWRDGVLSELNKLKISEIPNNGDPINIIVSPEGQKLVKRLINDSVTIGSICKVFNGVKPFEKGKGKPPQDEKIMKEKPYVKEGVVKGKSWSPLLRGSLIQRYINLWDHNYWIQYGEWLAAPRKPELFEAPTKIVVRQTGDSIIATLVEAGFIMRNNLHILLPLNNNYDFNFILGILNSKLTDFYYSFINPEKGEALAEVKKKHVEQLLIPKVSHQQQKPLIVLVNQMLELNKKLATAVTPQEKSTINRRIQATDQQIDQLVYDLYDLTPEEIALVEADRG